MTARELRRSGNPLLAAAALVVIIAGIKAARAIVVPLLLAIFVAVIAAPAYVGMRRRGVPALVALSLMIVALSGLCFATVIVVSSSFSQFTSNLPEYQAAARAQTEQFRAWLATHGIETGDQRWTEAFSPGVAMGMVGNLINGLSELLGKALLILLTVVFILLEGSGFPAKLRAISPAAELRLQGAAHMLDSIRRYMAVKTITSFITGGLIAVWLIMVGGQNPLLWGLLAFLLNFVPNIGSIIAAIPPVLIAMLQNDPNLAIWIGAGYLVINQVIGSLIEPRVMGQSVGLSTLVVFVSLVFWGWVLGPIGMLLSVPLTATARIALEQDPRTRWIAVLLGSQVPTEPKPAPAETPPPA